MPLLVDLYLVQPESRPAGYLDAELVFQTDLAKTECVPRAARLVLECNGCLYRRPSVRRLARLRHDIRIQPDGGAFLYGLAHGTINNGILRHVAQKVARHHDNGVPVRHARIVDSRTEQIIRFPRRVQLRQVNHGALHHGCPVIRQVLQRLPYQRLLLRTSHTLLVKQLRQRHASAFLVVSENRRLAVQLKILVQQRLRLPILVRIHVSHPQMVIIIGHRSVGLPVILQQPDSFPCVRLRHIRVELIRRGLRQPVALVQMVLLVKPENDIQRLFSQPQNSLHVGFPQIPHGLQLLYALLSLQRLILDGGTRRCQQGLERQLVTHPPPGVPDKQHRGI